jgi:hypothetical protein
VGVGGPGVFYLDRVAQSFNYPCKRIAIAQNLSYLRFSSAQDALLIANNGSYSSTVREARLDLKQYDDNGRFGFGDGELIKLSFWIEKDYGLHLLESPLSKDQQVIEGKRHYRINATVVDSAMLDWWLRGFVKAVTKVSKAGLGHRRQSAFMPDESAQ